MAKKFSLFTDSSLNIAINTSREPKLRALEEEKYHGERGSNGDEHIRGQKHFFGAKRRKRGMKFCFISDMELRNMEEKSSLIFCCKCFRELHVGV